MYAYVGSHPWGVARCSTIDPGRPVLLVMLRAHTAIHPALASATSYTPTLRSEQTHTFAQECSITCFLVCTEEGTPRRYSLSTFASLSDRALCCSGQILVQCKLVKLLLLSKVLHSRKDSNHLCIPALYADGVVVVKLKL